MAFPSFNYPPQLQGLKRPLQVGLAAGVATAVITLFMPNQYRSEARILPADARGSSGAGQLAAAAALVGVSIPGQDTADAAYVDILNSRWLGEQLVKCTYQFKQRPWAFGTPVPKKEDLVSYFSTKNTDAALRKLKTHFTINRDLKTKLLTITVETSSPELSQQICRLAVKTLNEFVVQRGTTRGGIKAIFAQKRLDEAREELAVSETNFRNFLYANRNYQISSDPSVRLKGLRLENELKLHTQVVTTLAISREQALLEEKNDMSILNILDDGNLPMEKSAPSRGLLALVAFLFASSGTWAWINRRLIQSRWINAVREGTPDVTL